MTPGELLTDGPHEDHHILNAGRRTLSLVVQNTSDRPIQVGSHYHFAETNGALGFDRAAAHGMRLNIASGTAVQAILDGDRGPHVVITRARNKRGGGLDALVQDRVLPALAAELLVGCLRAHLPVLVIAGPGVSTLPLVSGLLGALDGSSGLVRGLPAPAATPRGCVAIDAAYGSGHMAAAVRLLLATEVTALAVDEPEPAALEECAWASVGGRGVLVGVRAASLEQALARAHGAATASASPGIAYALAVMLGVTRGAPVGSFAVSRVVELRRDDQGPGSVQEIFGVGRRGELIPIAVPAVLAELTQRGVHIAPDLFTPV